MKLHYCTIRQAVELAHAAKGREVASIAYAFGADRQAVLDALPFLEIGASGSRIATTLEDAGTLAALPADGSRNEPDYSAGGLQIWVLARSK